MKKIILAVMFALVFSVCLLATPTATPTRTTTPTTPTAVPTETPTIPNAVKTWVSGTVKEIFTNHSKTVTSCVPVTYSVGKTYVLPEYYGKVLPNINLVYWYVITQRKMTVAEARQYLSVREHWYDLYREMRAKGVIK